MHSGGSIIAAIAPVVVACLAASCGSSNGSTGGADSATVDVTSSSSGSGGSGSGAVDATSSSSGGSGGEAGSGSSGSADSRPSACVSPDDCVALGSQVCCAAGTCALTWNVVTQLNNNVSCERDTDCLALEQGDGCNVVGKPRTTSCTTTFCGTVDGGRVAGPCCVGGTCQVGSQCQTPVPRSDAAADAGDAGSE